MRLALQQDSRIFVDLRASGVLRALAHSPTLVVRPEPMELMVTGTGAFEAPVDAEVKAHSIRTPDDLSASDADKMRENLLGPQVLDARRFPTIAFRGRYAGSMEAGTLSGDLHVRSTVRRVTIRVGVSGESAAHVARGTWEGRLTDLGVAPFKALLGAIRLEDWVAIRLELRFLEPVG